MIKLSKASKMPCRSWSLEALDTCPASKNKDGSLVDACKGCYATTGNYRFPNVRAPRVHNKEDWKRADWSTDMIKELDNDRYFRWFDSGDAYHIKLAEKMLEVMIATPWTMHWFPTRMHKFSKFQVVLEKMEALPNVVVRYSSDSIMGETVGGNASSTIIPVLDKDGIIDQDAVDKYLTDNMTMCNAYSNKGKCGECRACWSKEVAVIAYPAHGRSMLKQIKLIELEVA